MTQYDPFILSLDTISLSHGKLASLSTPKKNTIARNPETGSSKWKTRTGIIFFIVDYFDQKLGVSF
jgi:hypothetical protein